MSIIKLRTEVPTTTDIKDYKAFGKYEARSMHGQLPIIWDWAKDCTVGDRWGNEFLDFTSGICVANSGHGNENIVNGLRSLLDRPLLHTYTFGSDIRFWFLRELIETCYPGGKAFLTSAGTEATEAACKLMRMYTKKKYIISFADCMHGRTMLTEQLKGDYEWADLNDKIWHLKFPNSDNNFKEDIFGFNNIDKTAGIIIESYQGWSAFFYPKKYIQDLVKWAKDKGILVCFDEIQSGFGRTGKMFAWEHYDILTPDLICCGKGISSSLPLSVVIGRADILDTPEVGSMSSTHSANPMSCMAGLKNLLEFKKKHLVLQARRNEDIFRKLLISNKYKIQGKGMVWAIITNTEKEATDIVWECFKKGLLTIWTHRNSVKIAPPLIASKEILIEGIKIIKEVINDK